MFQFFSRRTTELLSITKLQNLKAIHNSRFSQGDRGWVVINHKTTKFESNSQRLGKSTKKIWSCYQSQNYKIWKQFTTVPYLYTVYPKLLSITKLQKFESNSQQQTRMFISRISCYQSQNYKIWKQFTTTFLMK